MDLQLMRIGKVIYRQTNEPKSDTTQASDEQTRANKGGFLSASCSACSSKPVTGTILVAQWEEEEEL